MPIPFAMRTTALVLCAGLALAGCKSKQEKAEEYFRSAETLLSQGDAERAMVQLRNVFDYDGSHREARRLYADLLLRQGRLQEAYSQYLRLVEQYPDLVEVHRLLSELSLRTGNLRQARQQAQATLELRPDDPGARAVLLALDLREAMQRNDKSAYPQIADDARGLTRVSPEIATGWHVLIDALTAQGEDAQALTAIDGALARNPAQYRLQVLKLRLISAEQDQTAIGAQLETMQALFPQDQKTRTALVAWFVLRDDPGGAARFLRKLASEPKRQTEGYIELVRFLARARGTKAARDELDTLISQSRGQPNEAIFTAMRADLDFSTGDRRAALERMKTLLARLRDGEQSRRLRVAYARMLDETGEKAAAQAQIAQVLKADALNVPALQQKARWMIAEDRPEDALVALRTALQQAPDDPETLTLMGEADLREGAPDLARGRFAQAYEASDRGAEEAIRYADFLLTHDRRSAARSLLTDAVEHNPDSPGLLQRQADLALKEGDWALAHSIADRLDASGTPEARSLAQSIRAAILMGRGRTDNAIETLKALAETNDGGAASVAAVIEAQLAAGRDEAAAQYLDEQLAKAPQSHGLRLLAANLAALRGENAKAEAGLRALAADAPDDPRPARQLYRLLAAQGRDPEALAVVETALAQASQPDTLLQFYRARALEKAGRYEDAIASYGRLYAQDGDNLVVANNLATLLSTRRDDPESLERAARIAKRFRERPEPAFKDTYGWAEYRLGRYKLAEPLLAAAAAGLPDNPLAQYHYAKVLLALGQTDRAARVLRHAVDLAGGEPPEAMTNAARELEALGKAD